MKIALISDTHIKESRPPCRSDDFLVVQEKKWRHFLNADVDIWLVGGDLFNTNPPSEFMKKWFLRVLNDSQISTLVVDEWYKHLFVVYGQHDMEHHSLSSLDRTGIAVLQEAGYLTVLGKDSIQFGNVYIYGANFGEIPPKVTTTGTNILVWHKMVIEQSLFPGQIADSAQAILTKYGSEYDLILTGDNHQTIIKQIGLPHPRWLVNPGSMLRLKADQAEHKPLFFIYDTDSRVLEFKYFPIDLSVISREHIKEEEDNKHLEEMIQQMKQTGIKLNFKNNLSSYLEKNTVHYLTKEIIWKSMEG
jgi:DNA repair exonuclease SbcCD nuclease subunit